jgi:carboxymethylenebutenolidase
MKDRITIEGRDGVFGAYIARPKTLPAPAVVVLHEMFGVNADIRQTCDELAAQGFIAVAPDLFWRQEPGVDLSVTSEADWQHGLRLNQAYDRDAGAKDVKDTAGAVAKLPECSDKVAVMGFCLGGLITFLMAARFKVDAAVAYHGGDTEKYLGEVDGLDAPFLVHLAEEDEFISRFAQAEIKKALARKPNATVYSYPGQHHAFAQHNGAHYNASAAALAIGRTREFLHSTCDDLRRYSGFGRLALLRGKASSRPWCLRVRANARRIRATSFQTGQNVSLNFMFGTFVIDRVQRAESPPC